MKLEVYYVLLSTGTEIITKAKKISGDLYLEDPCTVIYSVTTGPKMNLVKWNPWVAEEEDFMVNGRHVITCAKVSSDMAKYYFSCLKEIENRIEKIKHELVKAKEEAGIRERDIIDEEDDPTEFEDTLTEFFTTENGKKRTVH